MSAMPLSTYSFGYRLKSGELTTKKLATLCEQLEASFGPGYKIRPEPIVEGGIYFTDYPGKEPDHYKSMRFDLRGYPCVSDTALDEWKKGPDRVLCQDVKGMPTKVRAFYGAPLWTLRELETVRDRLRDLGIEVYVKSRPKAKQLVHDRPILGDPRLVN